MNKWGATGTYMGGAQGWDRDANSIDWELRPGGMLVQKRDGPVVQESLINVTVSHGLFLHVISVPAQATFGDLKKLLVHETNLKLNEMRLIFRGKLNDDSEPLHVAGVKDKARIILVEDLASRERRIEAMMKKEQVAKASEAVGVVRSEVDKLAGKIEELKRSMFFGTVVAETEFSLLTELLMRQLLKLDGIEADGEAKALRRTEVKRVQSLVEAVDELKASKVK